MTAPPPNRPGRSNPYLGLLIGLGLVIFLIVLTRGTPATREIPWSTFEAYASSGAISRIEVGQTSISGEFTSPQSDLDGARRFVTNRVDPELASLLEGSGIEIAGTQRSTLVSILLSWILPLVLIAGFWILLSRQMTGASGLGGYANISRSGAKPYIETETGVTFDDVAGVDEAKVELMEVVDFLVNPQAYRRLGAHVPKGVLLVGPPGTGKTLLARAVAGQAHVPFFSITGSEFVELFVGVGAARVRDLFEQARQAAPAIIFIDELDALGRARSLGQFGNHEEREQTLHQLLAELDGFDPTSGIVLLAATNRPEILDPALLRAGRFDRQILVDRPDKAGRVDILRVHIKKVRTDPLLDLEKIAAMTTGFSGADLANLVNEAAIQATRREAESVGFADFEVAIERIIAGLERRRRALSDKERRIIAHHELGHALTSVALPGSDPIQKISIIPRGIGALGYTIQRPTEDRYLMTRSELENRICILLGGRAAEQLIFGESSTGAADDLVKATDIAHSMVEQFGMDEGLGHVTYERKAMPFLGDEVVRRKDLSEATAQRIDMAVSQLVETAYDRAFSILKRNKSILLEGASQLLEKETLNEAEIADLTKSIRAEPQAAQTDQKSA